MYVFNTTIHSPEKIQRMVQEMEAASRTEIQGAPEDAGSKLRDAVQHRLNPAGRFFGTIRASAGDNGESFGEKVKKAVQKHPSSQQSHRERQEKARARSSV